jgi:hypothetical protein
MARPWGLCTGAILLIASLSCLAAQGDEIVFATRPLYSDGHWYASISYFARNAAEKTYASGGGLHVVDTGTGTVRALVEDEEGTVRDPAVHYDGKTILFSWRPGGTETFHLYTIQADGSSLTQLTDGEYDDFEPAWLPDGGIVFISTRCRRWVNCWLTQVAVAYRCDADGANITPLSANIEHDNTPWPMPDGRILYTRWEYVDRSQVDYHHLWTMNPDGTRQMVYFGNMHPGGLFIDAKPVPDSDEVLFINSPGHGAREHEGHVALVQVKNGPDDQSAVRNITGNGYRDPYPLDRDRFLAARGRRLVLLDRDGGEEILFTLDRSREDLQLHEPRPLRPRRRDDHRAAIRLDSDERAPDSCGCSRRPQHGRCGARRNHQPSCGGVAAQAYQLHGRYGSPDLRRLLHPRADPWHGPGRGGRISVFRSAR